MKVVPHQQSQSELRDATVYEAKYYDSDEEDNTIKQKKEKRPLVCRCLLSIRLFLTLVIIILVILTSFSIWITSYKVNEETAMSSVNVLIENIREKVSNYVNSQLLPATNVARNMAEDYHNYYIDVNNGTANYLLSKLNSFNLILASFGFAEGPDNTYPNDKLQTVSLQESNNIMVWGIKVPGPGLTSKMLNRTTGAVLGDYILKYPVYSLYNQSIYQEPLQLLPYYPDGVFGKPYKVPSSSIQLLYAVPVFDRKELAKKKRIGFVRVNLSLKQIADFLSKVKVAERGFVILAEYDTDFVIGTSVNVDLLFSRVPALNLTSRGAGTIMKKFYEKSNKADDFQASVVHDGLSYLVTTSIYRFQNVKWRMTLVFEENEIMEGIIMSSYIILGVSIGVCLLGIVISIILGIIITKPFEILERDFKKIEVLDLANIKARSSIFTENSNIYSRLTHTVQWLRDFRSFLPDSVLNQLNKKSNETKLKSKESHYKSENFGDHSTNNNSSNNDNSHHSQSSMSKKDSSRYYDKRDMFKLGLSVKECCVVNVRLNNMDDIHFPDPDLLSQTVSKVLTGISTICKTVKADLQIKSYDEFLVIFADRSNVSTIGLETALKIVQGIGHLNDNLVKNGNTKLSLSLGVSSGDSLQGNVGNKQTRYFALVGTVIARARDLCFMSSQFETPILTDQTTYKHGKQFIFRPVDRYLDSSSPNILTIYELVKKNVVDQDEWLYELEQKKQNSRYIAYNENFEKLFNGTCLMDNDLEHIRESLISINEQSEDRVSKRMTSLVKHHSQFSNYHSSVSRVIRSFLDRDQETPIHLE